MERGKMNDASLLKLSLFASVAGLILLAFAASQLQPQVAKIAEISYDDAGSRVVIKGQVIAVSSHKDGHVFLKISDGTGKIAVPIFSSLLERLDTSATNCLKLGGEVEILGRVEEFRGALEIVPRGAGDVRCLKS